MPHATLAEPPGPTGHWLKGHLDDYRDDRLKFLEDLRTNYGTMASYRLGPKQVVLVNDPDAIREVLVTRNKDFGRSFSTRMLREFFGDGLLISEGKRWLADRRLIQPSFAAEQVRAFGEAMVRHTAQLVDGFRDGETRDALHDMQSLTMSIAAETLLGVELADEVEAIHAPHELIRKSFDRRMGSLLTPPRWMPTPYNLRVSSAQRTITRIVDSLISRRRASQSFGPDILSRLMLARGEDGNGLDDAQLRNQALTFLFAGHETTASLLGWTWWLLGRHPEVERKLHAELDAVLAGRLPTVGDVPRLTYCDNIIRETLRLYPSVYVMGREALHDMELAGYRIRKGTSLVISPWLMQRDARFHARPLEFLPERWTDEYRKQLPQFAWFPFGAGPRICIGSSFAMLEAVLVLATIAARCRLDLVPGQHITPYPSVTLRPSPGIRVSVVLRRLSPAAGRGKNA